MKHKIGKICMILGVALILGALALFLYNQQQAQDAQQASANVMPRLQQHIQSQPDVHTAPEDLLVPPAYADRSEQEMSEVEIDGYAYIGYLTIPTLDLQLPVISGWSYDGLKIAPCRYTGTVDGDDLVIMAHNYQRHFREISQLIEGDLVIFTDVDGYEYVYQVVMQDVLMPSAVEEMTAGNFPLTLFTCTYGGANRITVYCDYVDR